MKTRILTLMIFSLLLFSSCATKKIAGGCFKCQCNGYSDVNGDGKCDTTRNNSPTKCGHAENEHD